METIGLIFGIIVFLISIGLRKTVKDLVALVRYIIKANEDENISKDEENEIIKLAKQFTGSLIQTVLKAISGKINRKTKANDVIKKLNSK